MKKLIRSKKTGHFLAADKKSWTEDLSQAWTFDSPATVLQILDHPELEEDVEMYFAFADQTTPYDFTLPISPTWRRKEPSSH